MRPILALLRQEHETILEIAGVAERFADRRNTGHQDTAAEAALNRFFMMYVHVLHRRKEDEALFPTLQKKGLHQGRGCVALLEADHHQAAVSFPESASGREWMEAVKRYCSLLRTHIRREDDVLFPIVESSLTDDEERELLRIFAEIDQQVERAGLSEVIAEARAVGGTATTATSV